MSEQEQISDIQAKLGNVRYEFSERPLSLARSVGVWRGSGLTHVATRRPFTFMVENNTLHFISLAGRPVRAVHTNLLDVGNGFYSNIPGEAFRGAIDCPMDALSLFIAPSLIEETLGIKHSANIAVQNLRGLRSSAPVTHMMRALLEDAKAGSPSGPLLGESIITAIINVAHPVETGKRELSDRRSAKLPIRTLAAINDVIHARISMPLHLNDLAKVGGMSVRHFSRAFRQSTGLSPHQYLLRARVEFARDLISRSVLSYDEIAWSAGFSDRNHMATVFRKVVGVSPSHFRER